MVKDMEEEREEKLFIFLSLPEWGEAYDDFLLYFSLSQSFFGAGNAADNILGDKGILPGTVSAV